MSPRDVGVVEGVLPAGLSDDISSFLDPAPGERRRRRHADEAAADDGALRRLLFGGMSLAAIGGLLLVAAVLVMAAGVFVANRDGPAGPYGDRGGYEHGRMSDRDQEYGYAYADYARRFDAGTAWSGWRADPDVWVVDPETLATGLVIGVIGVGLLLVARRRRPLDDG